MGWEGGWVQFPHGTKSGGMVEGEMVISPGRGGEGDGSRGRGDEGRGTMARRGS